MYLLLAESRKCNLDRVHVDYNKRYGVITDTTGSVEFVLWDINCENDFASRKSKLRISNF